MIPLDDISKRNDEENDGDVTEQSPLFIEEGVERFQSNDVSINVKKKGKTLHLKWTDLYVNALLPRPRCSKNSDAPTTLPLLRGVSGVAEPGKVVAIMGASGAGKTTLLNALSGHSGDGLQIQGSVSVNNRNTRNVMRSISAYVQQEDVFVGTLTVKEHLLFQAMLRMDSRCTTIQKVKRVNDVMSQLGLVKCQHTVIGVPGRIRGISGGEKKRLSFASEIITNPKMLFVDEPTSGLDSFMAKSCVLELQRLARAGRTVLVTIHQPSSGVFQLFDRLILLSEGRTAFHGSLMEAIDFFNECGYPTPLNFNPADHYIRTLAITPGNEDNCKKRSEDICNTYASSRFVMVNNVNVNCRESDDDCRESDDDEVEVTTRRRYQQGFCIQVREVMWRSTRQFLREPLVNKIRVFQSIFLSVVIGLLFLDQPRNQEGVANINGLLFLLFSLSFTTATSIVMLFPSEIPIMLKENKLQMYRVGAYFIGRNLAEVPWYFITTTLQATILYWMAGLPADFPKFVTFLGICHMNTQSALSYGMILSAAAPTMSAALALAGPCIMPLMVLGGFFVKDGSIPVYFVWLKVFSWMRYSFELAQINHWDGFGSIDCFNVSEGCLPDGQAVLHNSGYDPDNFKVSAGCLLSLIIGFRLVAFVLLVVRTYRGK